MTYTTIHKKIAGYLTEYYKLRDYDKKKRKKTYWEPVQKFVNSCKAITDIMGDNDHIKRQEKRRDVVMKPEDHEFYEKQCLIPQIGYCSSFIDRRWFRSNQRKLYDQPI